MQQIWWWTLSQLKFYLIQTRFAGSVIAEYQIGLDNLFSFFFTYYSIPQLSNVLPIILPGNEIIQLIILNSLYGVVNQVTCNNKKFDVFTSSFCIVT